MRPTPILAALRVAIFAASAANAKEFRLSGVHPMDYPTAQVAVDNVATS